MDKWTQRFIARAAEIAMWSKDPSSRVGAVLVKGHRSVSEGFNGPPSCWDDSTTATLTRDERLAVTIHAEENAILFADGDIAGATLYVTHHPCARCAAKLAQKRIKRVVMPEQDETFLVRWSSDVLLAQKIFSQASIDLVEIKGTRIVWLLGGKNVRT